MLLLAAQFWEDFGPEHHLCQIREIRNALKHAWKNRIFMWIQRHRYQYFKPCFSKEMRQIGCLLCGGGGKVSVDTLPGCTSSQAMLCLLHDALSSDLCHPPNATIAKLPHGNSHFPSSATPALPSQIFYLCNPSLLNGAAQVTITCIITHHSSGAPWEIITSDLEMQ